MLKVILGINNHYGSIQHGHEIIEKFDSVAETISRKYLFGFKISIPESERGFFIHPQHLNSDHPGVTRFHRN